MRRRRLLTSIVAVVVTCTLAGCGASADPLHAVVGAATRTLTRTVVSDLTLHGVVALGTVRPRIFARGAWVFRTGLGYEAIDLPAVKHQPAVREYVVLQPTKFSFERRLSTGTALYHGKSWVSAALTGPGSVDAIFPRFVEQVEGLSPQFLLDEILWGGESAAQVGAPVINHVPLTQYRVTVNLTRALSAATGPEAGAMRLAIKDELAALRSSRPASGSQTVTITLWVDGPGRVARLQATLPGSGLGTVSMFLVGYGVKLTTSLPPPSQVLEITAQTPGGGQMLRSLWVLGGS